MKVVINACFGGFRLSPLAVQMWGKRKGKECYFFINDYTKPEYPLRPASLEEATKKGFFSAYTVPNPEDYKLSERGTDGSFKEANERARGISLYDRNIARDDVDLIAVVEELGEKASGACASLRVVEVPDGVRWEIEEYDGNEHIAEVHRTWG